MKIFLSLFFLLIGAESFAECQIKPEIKKIISLSGTTTVLFKELGLLNDPKLQGISIFNPIQDYKGKVYPGGVYLSPSSIHEFNHGVVFFDEGRDMARILKTKKEIRAIEIKTRNLTPLMAVENSFKKMEAVLLGCDEKIREVKQKAFDLQEQLLQKIPKDFNVVFYLGEFKNGRPPEMVIVHDGVVKLLIEKNKIKTYPSHLSYVTWSTKIMGTLPPEAIHVGIIDSTNQNIREIKRSSKWMTLIYPGSLVPGISQLEAFLFWVNSL